MTPTVIPTAPNPSFVRSILDSLQHENVVQLVDKILDKAQQKLYIVMEVRKACSPSSTAELIGRGLSAVVLRRRRPRAHHRPSQADGQDHPRKHNLGLLCTARARTAPLPLAGRTR